MNLWQRLFSKARLEHDLDKELRFHFEEQVRAHMRSGMSEAGARRKARLEFGGQEQIREECRDARGMRWVEDLIQDLRYAVRQLMKDRGVTFVLLLTIALGIGVNVA